MDDTRKSGHRPFVVLLTLVSLFFVAMAVRGFSTGNAGIILFSANLLVTSVVGWVAFHGVWYGSIMMPKERRTEAREIEAAEEERKAA